jgi:tetratricopeptide (TPR) repeat protein
VRDAKNYIEYCRDVQDSESISQAYVSIAFAFLEMNRPIDALDSANLCISTYYPNPYCHFNKARALLRLLRFEEAKNSLNIAEATAKHELSVIDSYIIASRDTSKRESYIGKKSSYMAILEQIKKYKDKFFPK